MLLQTTSLRRRQCEDGENGVRTVSTSVLNDLLYELEQLRRYLVVAIVFVK